MGILLNISRSRRPAEAAVAEPELPSAEPLEEPAE